jgi:hypothetical protein
VAAYDDEGFAPPAPVARVLLKNPDSGAAWLDAPMLIDSGADVTLVPHEALERLGAALVPDRRYELLGFDGRSSFAPVVHLELVFCRRTFRGQFLVVEQPCGVLGRNVLNAIPLLLDGPHLSWDEHTAE